jgi:hypothetical protein
MVPKMEKKRKGGLYARTKANTMVPNPKKTPNITEALREEGQTTKLACTINHQPSIQKNTLKNFNFIELFRVY